MIFLFRGSDMLLPLSVGEPSRNPCKMTEVLVHHDPWLRDKLSFLLKLLKLFVIPWSLNFHLFQSWDLSAQLRRRDSLLMFWRVQDLEDVPDDSNNCGFAKWACWTSHTSAFFHSSRCKDQGPTSLWEKAPQTYHCQESGPSGSCQNLGRSGDRGRRVPYSSGTSTTAGSNRSGVCIVVSWR